MTTIVFSNGCLAVDSRSTGVESGIVTDSRNVKLTKLNDITLFGLNVVWMAAAGKTTHTDALRSTLAKGKGDLNDVLGNLKYALAKPEFSVLLLLEDGSCSQLEYRLTPNDKLGLYHLSVSKAFTEFTAIGSGSAAAKWSVKTFSLTDAREIVHMACKFDNHSGGQIYYVSPSDRVIRVYKGLSKRSKAKISEAFTQLL